MQRYETWSCIFHHEIVLKFLLCSFKSREEQRGWGAPDIKFVLEQMTHSADWTLCFLISLSSILLTPTQSPWRPWRGQFGHKTRFSFFLLYSIFLHPSLPLPLLILLRSRTPSDLYDRGEDNSHSEWRMGVEGERDFIGVTTFPVSFQGCVGVDTRDTKAGVYKQPGLSLEGRFLRTTADGRWP